MAQQVARLPKFLAALIEALHRKVPGATIDVKKDRGPDGYYYTVAVMADRFESMGWRAQHKPLWDTLYETLNDEQLGRVAVIAVRPSELNGY